MEEGRDANLMMTVRRMGDGLAGVLIHIDIRGIVGSVYPNQWHVSVLQWVLPSVVVSCLRVYVREDLQPRMCMCGALGSCSLQQDSSVVGTYRGG